MQLGREPIRAFGRLGEQIERIKQHEGGRFVSRQNQGHDFVAELAIGHAASPLLVPRGQESGEKVAPILAALAVPPYDAVDDVVDLSDCPPVPSR